MILSFENIAAEEMAHAVREAVADLEGASGQVREIRALLEEFQVRTSDPARSTVQLAREVIAQAERWRVAADEHQCNAPERSERQAIVAFLEAEAKKFDEASHFALGTDPETKLRLEAKASVIRTLAAYVERGENTADQEAAIIARYVKTWPEARMAAWSCCNTLVDQLQDVVACPACGSREAYTEAIDATMCTQPWCVECEVEMGGIFDEKIWPRILTSSLDQFSQAQKWLTDSVSEMPEVLRG